VEHESGDSFSTGGFLHHHEVEHESDDLLVLEASSIMKWNMKVVTFFSNYQIHLSSIDSISQMYASGSHLTSCP
jgi:hypothetical protein